MQMTMDQAMRPGILQAFAIKRRNGYVMRSEKRPGYSGGSAGKGGRKPRRPRAGFFYLLLTFLLSLILWPVGMVMLWRRKVRLQAGTKLLISLLTLCLSVFLIVFVLNMHVENPQFTAFQDKANDWLDTAYADLAVAGDAAYQKGVDTWNVMTDFAEKSYRPAMNTLADGLDKGVELAGAARSKVMGLFGGKDTPADVDTPVADGGFDVYLPENTPDPDAAQALGEGTLTADGALIEASTPEPTATPSPEELAEGYVPALTPTPVPTPTPTPSPTPLPELTVEVKPAGEATVYFNDDGKLYHMRSSCKSMSSAAAHTLAEAVEAGKRNCNTCGSPDAAILDEAFTVWADGKDFYHTTDACEKFDGQWRLISLNDAIAGGLTACEACEADIYALRNGTAEAPTPSPEPTPEPTPTPTPAPVAIRPATALKPVADATVYRSSNGKFYHKVRVCKGMTGSSPYKFSEVQGKYRRCTTCDAPDAALIGQACLWMDENSLCHTSDECTEFKGAYTLILRDDALARELKGCPLCGGNEYLIPGTAITE